MNITQYPPTPCRYEFLNVNIIFLVIYNTDKISKLKAIYNMIARSLSPLPDILSQTPDAANLQSGCAYKVKIYHGGNREFVLSHFSPSFAADHFYHAGLFSVSLISIKFIKRLDRRADDSFPGSLKCEARNRR